MSVIDRRKSLVKSCVVVRGGGMFSIPCWMASVSRVMMAANLRVPTLSYSAALPASSFTTRVTVKFSAEAPFLNL